MKKPFHCSILHLVAALTLAFGISERSIAQNAKAASKPADGVVTLPERTVAPPAGLSPEMLEVVKERQFAPLIPAPETTEDWLKFQKAFDAPGEEQGREGAKYNNAAYEVKEVAGVRTYFVTPETINERFKDHVFVHTHGGAWVLGGGDSVLREAVWFASGLGVKVISVDYRRPPLHPFPAAVDDAVKVWLEVTKGKDSPQTAIFGTSAGGNLALSTTLKLEQLGKPLPGAIFAGTPAIDLENISDTWITMVGLDPLGPREGFVAGCFEKYIGETDPATPLLSPVNGDLEGFPPTILISGTRDLLLSDTVRMHRALRKADVEADLHIYDGQTHGDYMQNLTREVPESEDAQKELFNFFDKHLQP